jgi:hypothetical protein
VLFLIALIFLSGSIFYKSLVQKPLYKLNDFFFTFFIKKPIIKDISKRYGEGKNAVTGKHLVSITPENIKDIGETVEETAKWDIIENVVSTDKYLFIIARATQGALIIPRKAFADDAAFNLFAETAKKYHQASLAAAKTA